MLNILKLRSARRKTSAQPIRLGFERLERRFALSGVAGAIFEASELFTASDPSPMSLASNAVIEPSAVLAGGALAEQSNGDTAVRGRIFADLNRNGAFDPEDVGLPGIRVFVDRDASFTINAGDDAVLTDSDGRFELPDAAGQRLGVVSNLTLAPHLPGAGYVGRRFLDFRANIGAHFFSFDAANGSPAIGFVPKVSIEGLVYEDLNGNLSFDDGDRRVDGVSVDGSFLNTSTAGTQGTSRISATTNADGFYHVTNSPAKVRIWEVASQEVLTAAPDFGPGPFSWQSVANAYRAHSEGIAYRIDVAVRPFQTVHGILYLDVDADGVRDEIRLVRPPFDIVFPDGSEASYLDYSVERDADRGFGGDDVAAATYEVVAAMRLEDDSFGVVGKPAVAALDGSFRLRVPAADGEQFYVTPNLDSKFWNVSTPLGGIASHTTDVRSPLHGVALGIVPYFGIDAAIEIIRDVLFIQNSAGNTDLSFVLDQTERDAIRDPSSSISSRISQWQEALGRSGATSTSTAPLKLPANVFLLLPDARPPVAPLAQPSLAFRSEAFVSVRGSQLPLPLTRDLRLEGRLAVFPSNKTARALRSFAADADSRAEDPEISEGLSDESDLTDEEALLANDGLRSADDTAPHKVKHRASSHIEADSRNDRPATLNGHNGAKLQKSRKGPPPLEQAEASSPPAAPPEPAAIVKPAE